MSDGEQAEVGRLWVVPASERAQKKLRTRRRRIRSYFGGAENIQRAAVTVSQFEGLIGIRIRISGSSAKALDASERYMRARADDGGITALCEALILTLQLHLNDLEVSVYYDADVIADPADTTDPTLPALMAEFLRLSFVETSKGQVMERLRRKLLDLKRCPNNELTEGAVVVVRQRIEAAVAAGEVAVEQAVTTEATTGPEALNRNTDRGALLYAAHWFVERARKLDGVRQIALIGSICTDKPHPKDVDLVVVVEAGADLRLLAKYRRGAADRAFPWFLGLRCLYRC